MPVRFAVIAMVLIAALAAGAAWMAQGWRKDAVIA
ncbi:lysis protein, partial [Bordetella avium]